MIRLRAVKAFGVSLRRTASILIFGYDAFLSHKHKDGRGYATELWTALERHGFTVCFDDQDFRLGDLLTSKMRGSVASSRHLIVLDTPFARTSCFVHHEIKAAFALGKTLIRIVDPKANACTWTVDVPNHPDQLSAAEIERLSKTIDYQETADAFSSGRCAYQAIAKVEASMLGWTTRQRLRRSAWAAATVILLAVGAWFMDQSTRSILKALNWSLDEPSMTLGQSLDDVRDFMAMPLVSALVDIPPTPYVVASVLYRDDVDDLINHALQSYGKFVNHNDAWSDLRVSPGQIAVAGRNSDGSFVIIVDRIERRCRVDTAGAIDAWGLDDGGDSLVTLSGAVLQVWQLRGCDGRAGGAVLKAHAPSELAHVTAIVVGRHASRILLANTSTVQLLTRVAETLRVSATFRSGRPPPTVYDVKLSPSESAVAISINRKSDDNKPDEICTTGMDLVLNDWCLPVSGLQGFQFFEEPQQRYLVTHDSLALSVWKEPPGGARPTVQPAAAFTMPVSVRSMAVAQSAAALALTSDSSGEADVFSLPSLGLLQRQILNHSSAELFLADVRHPRYQLVAHLPDSNRDLFESETLVDPLSSAYIDRGRLVGCSAERLGAPVVNCRRRPVPGLVEEEILAPPLRPISGASAFVVHAKSSTSDRAPRTIMCSMPDLNCREGWAGAPNPLAPNTKASCKTGLVVTGPSAGESFGFVTDGGRLKLSLSKAIHVPASSTLESAAFSPDCRHVAVSAATDRQSIIWVLDVNEPLELRTKRVVVGRVRALNMQRYQEGWLTTLISSVGWATSVIQQVPVTRQAVLEWLREETREQVASVVLAP